MAQKKPFSCLQWSDPSLQGPSDSLTHKEPVTYMHFQSHTLTMCSLIRMLSFGVTNPWTDRSCTETNSVYPNPRGFMSLIGRLNATSSGRDIMVSQMCWLESFGFTSMKVIRPVNGHTKLSSWSVRIRCMWRAIWVRSFGDRFIRAQNLQEQTILKCSFAFCTPLSSPENTNLLLTFFWAKELQRFCYKLTKLKESLKKEDAENMT